MTSEADSTAEDLSFQQNLTELDKLRKEQQDGEWEYKGSPDDKKALEAHSEALQLKARRCIELTRLLRRANTGPAKASGARGKSRARKAPTDIATIRAGLYD